MGKTANMLRYRQHIRTQAVFNAVVRVMWMQKGAPEGNLDGAG
jgi:hypothetical protein